MISDYASLNLKLLGLMVIAGIRLRGRELPKGTFEFTEL